jgi:hypothetical protein
LWVANVGTRKCKSRRGLSPTSPRKRQGYRIWHDLSTRRPGERSAFPRHVRGAHEPWKRKDPYAVSSLYGIGADTLCKEPCQGLWIPAFAGTTRGEDYGRSNQITPVETTEKAYAIALPQAGRGKNRPRPANIFPGQPWGRWEQEPCRSRSKYRNADQMARAETSYTGTVLYSARPRP